MSIASQLSFSTATSVRGGALGSIPYQSATSSTVFVSIGSAGTVLQSNGTAPIWAPAGGTTVGTSTQVQTVLRTTNASHFLTFVDSNNASATAETVYTTSSFSINPGTGVTQLNSNLIINSALSSTTGQLSITTPIDSVNYTGITLTNGFGSWRLGNNIPNAYNDTFFIHRVGNSTPALSVSSGLNIGINTAFPQYTFDVTGNARVTSSLGIGTPPSGVTGEIRATNEITAYFSSDIRLKENIRLIADPITIVNQIRGVYYDWTDEHIKARGGEDGYFVRKHDIGVIAQEVEAVLPEIVAERDDGTKVVKYEKLVALLIEAVKDQQKQINQISQALQNLAIK
jgi:hypothetical protein